MAVVQFDIPAFKTPEEMFNFFHTDEVQNLYGSNTKHVWKLPSGVVINKDRWSIPLAYMLFLVKHVPAYSNVKGYRNLKASGKSIITLSRYLDSPFSIQSVSNSYMLYTTDIPLITLLDMWDSDLEKAVSMLGMVRPPNE